MIKFFYYHAREVHFASVKKLELNRRLGVDKSISTYGRELMPELDDELMERFQKGDEGAFTLLVRRHERPANQFYRAIHR